MSNLENFWKHCQSENLWPNSGASEWTLCANEALRKLVFSFRRKYHHSTSSFEEFYSHFVYVPI